MYENEAIGWMALAPREDYIKIENARSLKRIDDKPVWSITCLFIKKKRKDDATTFSFFQYLSNKKSNYII